MSENVTPTPENGGPPVSNVRDVTQEMFDAISLDVFPHDPPGGPFRVGAIRIRIRGTTPLILRRWDDKAILRVCNRSRA